jgi:hypothetical protein
MIKDKRVLRIQVVQILEIDNVDSMEKVLVQGTYEISVSIDHVLRYVQALIQSVRDNNFSFL